MNFLQTKPHVKSMNINYYHLFYTVNKNLVGKENEVENEISDKSFQTFHPKKRESRTEVDPNLAVQKRI